MNQRDLSPQRNAASALDALQARFALRVASTLTERADRLEADVGERLRFGREQALARARTARSAEATAVVGGSNTAVLGRSGWGWWMRIGAVVPAFALVAGLVVIQKWQDNAQISVAAEIDAALLADDLPPTAYSDAGFAEFLKTPHE